MPKSARAKVTAKTKPAIKKAAVPLHRTVAASKAATKSNVKKTAPKAKFPAKKRTGRSKGIISTVSEGVAGGVKSAADFVKRITPDVFLPQSAKTKKSK